MSIFQYLSGTKDKFIHYNKNNKFIGYSDSDFANDEKTRRSTSGYLFIFGNSLIA